MILTLNSGSSSVKFSLFQFSGASSDTALCLARGQIEGLGAEPSFEVRVGQGERNHLPVPSATPGKATHNDAIAAILTWLGSAFTGQTVHAVGHRVVHGGTGFEAPVVINDGILTQLEQLVALAPLHQPHNLAGIRAAQAAFKQVPQIACFDTAFHRCQPFVSQTFALPHHYFDEGVRRYGFHGLSYEFITAQLRQTDPALASGRVVVAHLGNGASMAAVHNGKSVASTMGFTALDGLPMGTRSGQIDPGVLLYLMDAKGMSATQIGHLLYKQSGLLGMSGLSQDMRTLEASQDPKAQAAIDYFCHRISRETAALAAAMGGIDALVFTGGIGEHSSKVRAQVCASLTWMGIELDPDRNAQHCGNISSDASCIQVRVMQTDEEQMIAKHCHELIG